MRNVTLATSISRRKRRRVNGRLVPIRNAASARNARLARKVGTLPALARALRSGGALDQRFALSKVIRAYASEYRAHVGDAASAPLTHLCDSAARHRVIANVAFTDLMQHGLFTTNGSVRGSFEVWRRADGDLRECLRLLGLERKARDVPTLAGILAGEESGDD